MNSDNTKKYERLGALKFQEFVFFIEKIKFKFIKKICPNIIYLYEKQCKNNIENQLSTVKNKNNLKKYFINEAMMFKKEINSEQNRNYHIDSNNIGEIKKYIEMNKTIHTNSFNNRMLKILITIFLTIILSNMFPLLTFIILVYEIIGVIVDLECVNLQNYNLCRLSNKKTEIILKKIEEKNNKQFEKNMKNGINVIERTFNDTNSIPKIDDIISNIKSKEELIELLNYSKNELNKRIKKKKL